ncbi:MAG: iron-sulfur cluster assembly scaffold protein [Gammaproteobacteria bacterium]
MSRSVYSDLVMHHFEQPANAGPLAGDMADVFTGAAGQRESGTQVRFQARIDAGRISDMGFQAYGCPHTIAACSLATQRLLHQPAAALMTLDRADLMEALSVPVEKTGRMLVLLDALHHCFRAWENRQLAGKPPA